MKDFSTSSTAERPSRRHTVTRDNWREICPCQRHAARRGVVQRLAGLSGRARTFCGAIVVAAPLAFGASSLPIERFTLEALQSAKVEQPRPGAQTFAFIIPERRDSFLDRSIQKRIAPDAVREEYFRTEVPFGDVIYREALKNGLSPELVAAVVITESDFRPRLISSKNAQGLMQIIPETGRLMGARNLMDPADNVAAGTRYLRYLHRRFRGDRRLILAAYNAGEGNIARFNGIPPFPETENYLVRVGTMEQEYQRRVKTRVAELRDCR